MGDARAERFFASELGLRILSAIVLLVVVLGAAWMGGTVFLVLCLALSAVLFYEWQKMVSVTPFDAPEALLTGGFVLLLGSFLVGYGFVGLFLFIALGLVLEVTSDGVERDEVRWIGLGALYCAVPALALPYVRDTAGFGFLLFVFLVVWVTDIGGYFAGRSIGGPKLWPAVSPKKTKSGAMGGLLAALVIGWLAATWHGSFSVLGAMAGAFALSIVSQAGDLFESAVKRRFDTKDSSGLIPGHGGFLDRVDGLIAASVPAAAAVALAAA